MTNTAILAASALLLFAYALEHFGRHFKLPSVVLLIVTGLIVRQVLDSMGLHFHWVDPIVPVIGTLGLILIVLEGALDLKVSREPHGLIVTALASSLLGFLAALAGSRCCSSYMLDLAMPTAMLAAIPFAVISSAVAIPSAAGFPSGRASSSSTNRRCRTFSACWCSTRGWRATDRSRDSRSTSSAAV